MRISDWSSDVCSSDLNLDFVAHVDDPRSCPGRRRLNLPLVRRVGRPTQIDRVLLGVNIDRLGWERQTCACIGQPSLPLQRMISWYHDKQQADHPVPSRVILRRRFALSLHEEDRQFGVPQGSLVEGSEEPTSELKSL